MFVGYIIRYISGIINSIFEFFRPPGSLVLGSTKSPLLFFPYGINCVYGAKPIYKMGLTNYTISI